MSRRACRIVGCPDPRVESVWCPRHAANFRANRRRVTRRRRPVLGMRGLPAYSADELLTRVRQHYSPGMRALVRAVPDAARLEAEVVAATGRTPYDDLSRLVVAEDEATGALRVRVAPAPVGTPQADL